MFTNNKINGKPYFYKKKEGTNRSFNYCAIKNILKKLMFLKFHVSN